MHSRNRSTLAVAASPRKLLFQSSFILRLSVPTGHRPTTNRAERQHWNREQLGVSDFDRRLELNPTSSAVKCRRAPQAEPSRSGRAGSVNPLQLVELFAVHFGVRAQEVQVCTKRLPLALGRHLLFCKLVALTFMDMKDIDLHVFGPARQIRKYCGAFAEVADHVATDVTAEDGARQRILEQDLDHLCSLKSLMAIAGSSIRKYRKKSLHSSASRGTHSVWLSRVSFSCSSRLNFAGALTNV